MNKPRIDSRDIGVPRDGSQDGRAGLAVFDGERRCFYRVNRDGSRTYFGVPDGHEFDGDGNLREVTSNGERD